MCASLQNPGKWRFTWETLAHLPILRLFLFNSEISPSKQCNSLKSSLLFEQSLVVVSWMEEIGDRTVDFLLRVPVPRVLIDLGSPVDIQAKEDHIEVKLVLILPVDHPLVSNFDLGFDFEEEGFGQEKTALDPCRLSPHFLDSDLKSLSSKREVHFFCKNCSTKLTKNPLRSFVEMPSVNWREVADNWFGACCCSFGGISEKLATAYANSYICTEGICLLDDTSVIICKDDLLRFIFSDPSENELICLGEALAILSIEEKISGTNRARETPEKPSTSEGSVPPGSILAAQEPFIKDSHNCCVNHAHERSSPDLSVMASNNQPPREHIDFETNLNEFKLGPLGNGFIVNTSNHSKEIEWVEFLCIKCSSLLGSFPSVDRTMPIDGGVRLYKCHISTSTPVGEPGDIFGKHTLQKMFVNQLLETATDELSYRTLVRDLRTKSPVLQIVLLNSKAWCCTGDCLDNEPETKRPVPKLNLLPVVKVLFSDFSLSTEADVRKLEEWATKNQANEVYMMTSHIKRLTDSFKLAQEMFPFSCSFLQGLSLSTMER